MCKLSQNETHIERVGNRMIIFDMEVFKYDFILCWLDTKTRKKYCIVNDTDAIKRFYEHYKNDIMVGYNSRGYDQWILKSILCDFNPWDMNDWIINKDRKGYEFSRLLNKFPIRNYDCSVGFRSLKELEAFMGDDIRESSVPWDIDRKLTEEEIRDTLKYCYHDVDEAFRVFVETKEEFESHIGLIQEFDLGVENISKTKAQLSALILGASKVNRNDEFDIRLPETLDMGQYDWIREWYLKWAKDDRNYETMSLTTEINGVPHTFGIGGLHGSRDNYYGEGLYLMADVASYYPALMIEYDYLSRNVINKDKFRQIRDERMVMKQAKDPRQQPRKIVLNSTFGASKDQYNNLYDPLQANNICIAGQLLLVDLLDKLDGKCELIQSNTDGILVKLYNESDKQMILDICKEWSDRTRMELEFEEYVKVIQKDVNNYIIVDNCGGVKRKGAFVKKLNALDNDLPIVNRAVVSYFVSGTPVEQTVNSSNLLIDFQKVTKVSSKYDYAVHNGVVLSEKVHRCFASTRDTDGTLYKKHKNKTTLDKTGGTPERCFINNSRIVGEEVPSYLDREWYIELAKDRIKKFLEG